VSVSASRHFPEGALPAGALGEFFREVETLVLEKGAERTGTVRVAIDHSGEMTEFADWSIQQLYAVTDLRSGHPIGVTYGELTRSRCEVRADLLNKLLWLNVVAPDAEVASSLLSLGDRYLAHPEDSVAAAGTSATLPHPNPSTAVAADTSERAPSGNAGPMPSVLDWFEHLTAYRVLVIVGSAAGGLAVLYGVVRLIAALVH
jgi:hypothetical protein